MPPHHQYEGKPEDVARRSVRLEDRMAHAEALLFFLSVGNQNAALEAKSPITWKTAYHLIDNEHREAKALGYALALMAVLRAPDVLQSALTRFAADFWEALDRPDLFDDDVLLATMLPVLAAWLRGEERVA